MSIGSSEILFILLNLIIVLFVIALPFGVLVYFASRFSRRLSDLEHKIDQLQEQIQRRS